jgi:hypothetical protein
MTRDYQKRLKDAVDQGLIDESIARTMPQTFDPSSFVRILALSPQYNKDQLEERRLDIQRATHDETARHDRASESATAAAHDETRKQHGVENELARDNFSRLNSEGQNKIIQDIETNVNNFAIKTMPPPSQETISEYRKFLEFRFGVHNQEPNQLSSISSQISNTRPSSNTSAAPSESKSINKLISQTAMPMPSESNQVGKPRQPTVTSPPSGVSATSVVSKESIAEAANSIKEQISKEQKLKSMDANTSLQRKISLVDEKTKELATKIASSLGLNPGSNEYKDLYSRLKTSIGLIVFSDNAPGYTLENVGAKTPDGNTLAVVRGR